mmetsp:Transcript_75392/g.191283  ORF Transcript_75392/g.191283 Transcript_75392/m.191283 type:complete len:532 (+) Transcript_75392:53-1648(+)
MGMDDEEHVDDMSIGLQMQQFLDEWHYRVLHSGMATEWDHADTMFAAMSLFQAHGLVISEEEKRLLAREEEDHIIQVLVRKMTPAQRRTFEHFALQLQLFVSAATRMRTSIEEGEPEDIRRVVEEGDKAITQHILKQTVVEAAQEISEVKSVHDSWSASMGQRINRLTRTAENTGAARAELERINRSIQAYSMNQNELSVKFLTAMLDKSKKGLLATVLNAWSAHHVKHKSEKDIHEKFRAQIQVAEDKLIQYKADKVANVRKALMRSAGNADQLLQTAVLRSLAQVVKDGKDGQGMQKALTEQQARMDGMKESHKKASRNSMMRMCAGNDASMLLLCFQTWHTELIEMKADKDSNLRSQELEIQLKSSKLAGNKSSTGVLNRLSQSTDTALLAMVVREWSVDIRSQRQSKIFDEQIGVQNQKFASLKSAQKGKAMDVSQRASEMENSNTLMSLFLSWQMEVRLARVVRHYSGQMETKKRQLESVRTMFNQFANELGDISNTPRKSSSSKPRGPGGGESKRPPQAVTGLAI